MFELESKVKVQTKEVAAWRHLENKITKRVLFSINLRACIILLVLSLSQLFIVTDQEAQNSVSSSCVIWLKS
jgi:hypothetical protein